MRQISSLKICQIAVASVLVFWFLVPLTQAAVLKAKVRDIDGKPLEGAKIFLYESINVRKPADFISAQSDKNGQVNITVPTGKYWSVARLKKDALYGPLMPGDKHSGEPLEVDFSDNPETEVVFVVADIREIGMKKQSETADTIKLWGRVVDKEGKPVEKAYVFANSTKEIEFIPEFLSAWTDENGNYLLYLPSKGRFYVGSSKTFPPTSKPLELKVVVTESAKLDVATDIQLIVY